MSDDRQTLPPGAVDQGARAAQADADAERIQTEEEVVEAARRRVAELEEADRQKEETLAAERRRAQEAENRAAEADRRAREAESRATQATSTGQQTVDHARLSEVTTALTARNDQMSSLETQYAAAFTAGEGEKMAKIQREMATLGGKIAQLEQSKMIFESRIEQAKQQQQNPQPQTQSVEEYRRNFVSQQPPLIQEWLRRNGERYWSDQDFQDRAAAAARYADRVKRIPIDSQAYIDFVDEELGLKTRQQLQSDPPRNPGNPPPGRNAEGDGAGDPGRRFTAAPAGGGAPGSNSGSRSGDGAVYLSRDEKDMAKSLGLTEAEYALNKRELTKDGFIGQNARRR